MHVHVQSTMQNGGTILGTRHGNPLARRSIVKSPHPRTTRSCNRFYIPTLTPSYIWRLCPLKWISVYQTTLHLKRARTRCSNRRRVDLRRACSTFNLCPKRLSAITPVYVRAVIAYVGTTFPGPWVITLNGCHHGMGRVGSEKKADSSGQYYRLPSLANSTIARTWAVPQPSSSPPNDSSS